MLLVVCVVRDRAVDAFMRPFFVTHVGGALRGFTDEVNAKSGDSPVASHPDDYELYELGSFNDADASFVLFPKPRLVAVGKDLVRNVN